MLNTGFSLIELLVVVTILGMISAVGVSAYNSYTAKMVVNNALEQAEIMIRDIQITVDKTGKFPDSIKFNNVTLNNNVSSTINIGNIYSIIYLKSANEKLGMVYITISGIKNTPNYTDPATSTGAYSGLHMAVVNNNGVNKFYCGAWDYSGYPIYDVPLSIMPGNCTCRSLGAFVANNGVGSC